MSANSDPKPPRITEMLCSNCQKSVVFDLSKMPAHFPFCSMRCKALDLGMWLEPEDEEDEDSEEADEVVAGDFSEEEPDLAEPDDFNSGDRLAGP